MIGIDLSNKTAIVTGASQGLGEAIARTLHTAGANVVVNYYPDEDGTNRVNAEEIVNELGDRTHAIAADVQDFEQVQRLFERAKDQFESVDILVNNAGIIRDRTIRKMSLEEWQAVMDTNLSGVFHAIKAAGDHLADGGRIVNLASIAAVVGFFGQANYAAAKAGVIGLTKVASKELAGKAIRVNAVAPGVVLTDMGKTIPEEVRTKMIEQIPLGRFGQPKDIANAVLYLCSDLADYVTGQTLHVNGGWWVN